MTKNRVTLCIGLREWTTKKVSIKSILEKMIDGNSIKVQKKFNIYIIAILKREEKIGTENMFNNITAENFPYLKEDINQ